MPKFIDQYINIFNQYFMVKWTLLSYTDTVFLEFHFKLLRTA